MSGWRVAPALDALLGQLNACAPGRSKTSDGAIGDAEHASRDSDHNPWVRIDGQAWVTARDFTHDPGGGLDGQRLADALRTARDERVKYLIWQRRIMSGAAGPVPWLWRPYAGSNPHTKHVHLSVVADRRALSPHAWTLPGFTPTRPGGFPTVARGDTGWAVELLHRFLGVAGPGDPDYGTFTAATDAAVRRYQGMRGLEVDGIVGPATWRETGLRVAA